MANVTLLSYSPNPEQLVAAAAKLCYSSKPVDELLEGLDAESSTEFVDMLSDLGHESPVEHVSFTFAISGVSRALLAQLTRHRIASYSVRSQRYVNENNFDYVVPPEIAANKEAQEVFIQAMEQAQSNYAKIADLLTEKHMADFVAAGEPEKSARSKARKLANEDARFVLPNACDTQMIVTMNTRSLLNFFHHRCCNRAQWEIRALADQMLGLVYQAAPALFRKAGPSCLWGGCPEGKMSCGKMPEVRDRYRQMKENIHGE